jgi:hypothetical protein
MSSTERRFRDARERGDVRWRAARSSKPLPLRRYANGGIAHTPQLAMFGEGKRPEAYVPLPDGRTLRRQMRAGRCCDERGQREFVRRSDRPIYDANTFALGLDCLRQRVRAFFECRHRKEQAYNPVRRARCQRTVASSALDRQVNGST